MSIRRNSRFIYLFALSFILKCDCLQQCVKMEGKETHFQIFNVDQKLVTGAYSLDGGQSYINRLACSHLEDVNPDIKGKVIINRKCTSGLVDRCNFLSLMDILFYKGMLTSNEYEFIKKLDCYEKLVREASGFVIAVSKAKGNVELVP